MSDNTTAKNVGMTLIQSPIGGEGKEKLYSMINESVRCGVRTFLIVPEQQTVMAEAEMAEILPPSAPLIFEATNFTRFANTVFRSLGGVAGEYCSPVKKRLIVWRTLTELSSVLTMTGGRREISAGVVDKTVAAIGEIESLSITPKMLEEASEYTAVSEDPKLTSKLLDLSKILTRYKQLINEKYLDTADDLSLVADKLSESSDFLSGAHIYIEGFTSFTEPQYKLIELLCSRCSLTVLLYLSKSRQDAFENTELAGTKKRLFVMADKAAVPKRSVSFDGHGHQRNELISEIARNLWVTNYKIDKSCLQVKDNFRIFKAYTPFEEFEFLSQDIKRRVMAGAKYSDFAIIARDAKVYDGILDTALKKAEVPAFTSYKRDVSTFAAVKLIFSAYAAIRSGFRREDVIAFSKCAPVCIDSDGRDEFELYCERWQISGVRFTDGIAWNMNPLGYTVTRDRNSDAQLLRINEVREKLITPLVTLRDDSRGTRSVRDHAFALVKFLDAVGLEAELLQSRKKAHVIGEHETAEEIGKLWKIICDALDTLVEVLGDYPTDAEGFISQFAVAISSADIGRIPAFTDEVTVGSADMLRLSAKKHLYLVGVNAGEFPATVGDNSYFSDKDKALLSLCGLAIAPDLEVKSARELFCFSRALSYATDTVTVLYSEKSTAYKSVPPSDAIERIVSMTDGGIDTVSVDSIDFMDRTYSYELAEESLGNLNSEEYTALCSALDGIGKSEKIEIANRDITNTSLRLGDEYRERMSQKDLALTQTRIDSFINCPLEYFLKFSLGLQDTKKAEFDAANIGSFVHSILENFFREIRRSGKKIAELTEEEKRSLTESAARKYLTELGESEIDSAKFKLTAKRLCRAAIPVVDGLCDEFSECEFEPSFFELKIGGNDAASPKPTVFKTKDGRAAFVYGTIDRVDTLNLDGDVYVRVIDYKTGRKTFNPEDISEGKNLQMFLYLKSITDTENPEFKKMLGVEGDGRILPAGVIYVKTSVKDERIDHSNDEEAVSAVKAAQAREGMVTSDNRVLNAMNPDYLPVRFKNGEIEEKSKKYLFSESDWEDMMKELEGVITNVAERIKCGEIRSAPAVSHRSDKCDYCEYKPICRIREL